jgi:SAM-dependent methyltransferase/GNAT superfamily N-acetyltransferase
VQKLRAVDVSGVLFDFEVSLPGCRPARGATHREGSGASVSFYPAVHAVPDHLVTSGAVIRQLRAVDAEMDYEALMANPELLRSWDQSDWPSDGFTLDENRVDLEEHEREHAARESFTYTVMDSDEQRCLGCVYIHPLRGILAAMSGSESAPAHIGELDAYVTFWVRESELSRGLDRRLLEELVLWFRREWEFTRITLGTHSRDQRQLGLFRELGFVPTWEYPVPGRDTRYVICASEQCAGREVGHRRAGTSAFEGTAMSDGFSNVYDDGSRAEAYAKLEFPGTYYLAYRDLPAIIAEHVSGGKAIDFGCGTGRSTRFLRELGFDPVGLDIAEHMLARAREADPAGDYRLVPDGDLGDLESSTYDLILSVFTFDNIPTMEKKVNLFRGLRRALNGDGCIVSLVSSPDIYVNEWASFSTKDFPENRCAKSGDRVLIVMLDVEDDRPVEDIVWSDEDYGEVYRQAGLEPISSHRPLGKKIEPYPWVSETTIAPWVIYVLKHAR